MRKAPVLIVVFLAALTAGCALSGKPRKPAAVPPATPNPVANTTPAPPAQPLSIPQTQVELPKPQPIDDAALPADPAPPVDLPADTATGTRSGQGRGAQTRSGTQQRSDAAQPSGVNPGANPGTNPAAGPAVTPPPAATPPEPPGPALQEVVTQAELKRYQEQAQGKVKEAQQILEQYSKRPRLTPAQEEVLSQIKSFIDSSQAAEKRGDMKTADALAERAQIKARDLVNGR